MPVFIFTILFGLSMDYHVFILTRIKEARDRGMSSNEAVARGISITSGTITSAAAIMVVVFAVFVTLELTVIKQLGLGPRGRGLPRRDDRPEHPAAGDDAAPRRLELVAAALAAWLPHVTIEGELPETDDEPVAAPPAMPVLEGGR